MPTLDFKGKSFVYAHHLSVPFRELVVDADKSLPPKGGKPSLNDNLIIHGDNLHALKALLPVYAGKVDCIYIDPPYNTGNEGWCYNDNVRSPLMREWLKKAAPVDKEDLERHDKWLCMMWPRMQLLRELLSDSGVLFVSIDDYEAHRLELMLDEVFGKDNNLGRIVVRLNPKGRHLDRYLAKTHEYVLVFCKNAEKVGIVGIDKDGDMLSEYDDQDERGRFRAIELRNRNSAFNPETRKKLYYPIYVDSRTGRVALEKTNVYSQKALPHDSNDLPTCWTWGKTKFADENEKLFGRLTRDGTWRVFRKDYLQNDDDEIAKTKVKTIWLDADLNMDASRKVLREILSNNDFDFPKPVPLVERLIKMATKKNSIVLDSFAGSGTTAHATLKANASDNYCRKFILVETEDYADKLTAERVRRVINGYSFEGVQREELMKEALSWPKFKKAAKLVEKAESVEQLEGARFDKVTKQIEDNALVVIGEKTVAEKADGLGGSFTYCELGPEMSVEKLLSDGLPSFEALAKYVYFTATGGTLTDLPKGKAAANGFIGETELYRVHLHYKQDRIWLQSNDAAITETLVETMLAANTGKKKLLVFAAAKFMGQRELTKLGVDFCQLPYAIHRILGE